MTSTTSLKSTKANIDLSVGDIIIDDIPARITAVVYADHNGVCVAVEDGNGYRYQVTRGFEGFSSVINWTDEDWASYRAL